VGALSWARELIADTGQVEPIPVAVDGAGDAYFLCPGVRGGLDGHTRPRIPVTRRPNPAPHPILKEIHACEVAGRMLEAESADALRGKVAAMLETMSPAGRLPLAYFRAPAAHYELPVYEDEGRIVVHGFGGPRSRSRDLAGVRGHVARHLTTAGYLGSADDLEVAVVDPVELRLHTPRAVFRSLADRLWLPWTEVADGDEPALGPLGLSARPGRHDVLGLLRWVRARAGASEPGAVYASAVRADELAEVAGALTETELSLSAGGPEPLVLPVCTTALGELVVAVDCGGADLLMADTPEALARLAGRRLHGVGFLADAGAVTFA
jgi:hypothetical protein